MSGTDELRGQIAQWLCERRNDGGGWDHEPGRRYWLEDADALLSGPLAPLLADHAAMERVREMLRVWGTVAQPRDSHTKLYVLRRALDGERSGKEVERIKGDGAISDGESVPADANLP